MLSVEEVSVGDLGREIPDIMSSVSTVFGTPSWVEAGLRSKRYGGAFRKKAMVAREGRNLCGFLVGCELRVLGFKALFSPLPGTMSQYGGLSVLPEFKQAGDRITESLLWAAHASYDIGFIITSPGQCFSPRGRSSTWTVIPRKSLAIDLSQERDKLWANMRQQARNGVRRAQKNGVTVDFVSGLDTLQNLLKTVVEAAARTDWSMPVGEAFFRDVLGRLSSNFVIARTMMNGEFVAGAVLIYDTRTLYCHTLATNSEGRRSGAGDFLQWSIANWAKERGLASYDLLGANIPRIARFKSSFGATEINYDAISFGRFPFLAHLGKWALAAAL